MRNPATGLLRSSIMGHPVLFSARYTPTMRASVLFMLASAAAAAQMPVCNDLQAAVATSSAHWGISVVALDGTTICAINAAQLYRPASNNKLFTTAAALGVLGPAKTFETTVTGNFNVATGTVSDLTLVGGGDANLDSGDLPYTPGGRAPVPFRFAALEKLAAQMVAKGVKTVRGDVVGDDRMFSYQPYVPSWELEDVVSDDGAPVSALTIADNQMTLTVAPAAVNKAASVTLDQHGVPYYKVLNQVQTVSAKALAGFHIERLPGSRTVRVFGTIAADAPPDHEEIAIDEPALYAAMAFRQVLIAAGVEVSGTARSTHRENTNGTGIQTRLSEPLIAEASLLHGAHPGYSCIIRIREPAMATYMSAPLAEDITYTNKVSQNLHAELLLHALGRVVVCFEGSNEAGVRMVRAFLLDSGIANDDIVLYDGSGLSSHDLVAPRALTQLLVYAAKQPWFDTFKASLPVGGVDGSLANRFTGALKGKVLAKTGSLGESRALSGYVTAASGKTLAFSIMDDNHLPGSTADRLLMDHLVEMIAAAN